jgi:hypothetical protein
MNFNRFSSMAEFSFKSEEEHKAALYDACSLIVNTYNQTDAFDSYDPKNVTPYQFMLSARNVLNQIAESYSR